MRRDGRKTWAARGFGALLLAATFGYLPYRLYARSGLSNFLDLDRDLTRIRGQNAVLRSEIERLTREASILQSDPRAIERAARGLGYVKPGETLFDVGMDP